MLKVWSIELVHDSKHEDTYSPTMGTDDNIGTIDKLLEAERSEGKVIDFAWCTSSFTHPQQMAHGIILLQSVEIEHIRLL